MNYVTKTILSFSIVLLTNAALANEVYPWWAVKSEQEIAYQWQLTGRFAVQAAYSPYLAYTRPRTQSQWQVQMTFEAYTNRHSHHGYYGNLPQHATTNTYHKIDVTLIANRYFKQFRVDASTHYDNLYSRFYRIPFGYRQYP
ncbi:MAG: hypothetical protein BWK79_04635 [Beggiatoa sp. IS2]|nr:MAG: hypothetical protein BWK79_04635 [Beggiatoa sp. IS2]